MSFRKNYVSPEKQRLIEKAYEEDEESSHQPRTSRPWFELEEKEQKEQKKQKKTEQISTQSQDFKVIPVGEISSFKTNVQFNSKLSADKLKQKSSCFTIFNVLTGNALDSFKKNIDALSDHSESRPLSQCFTDLMDSSPSEPLKKRFTDLMEQPEGPNTEKKSLKTCFTDLMETSPSKSLKTQLAALMDKSEPKSLKKQLADLSDKIPLEKQFTDFINMPAAKTKNWFTQTNSQFLLHGNYANRSKSKRVVKAQKPLLTIVASPNPKK